MLIPIYHLVKITLWKVCVWYFLTKHITLQSKMFYFSHHGTLYMHTFTALNCLFCSTTQNAKHNIVIWPVDVKEIKLQTLFRQMLIGQRLKNNLLKIIMQIFWLLHLWHSKRFIFMQLTFCCFVFVLLLGGIDYNNTIPLLHLEYFV